MIDALATAGILLSGNVLGPLLLVLWMSLSGESPRRLGLDRPARWGRTLVVGAGLGLALKLVMKVLVLPALAVPPTNPIYHYLVGNTRALLQTIPVMIVAGGLGEEMIWRGLLFARLTSWIPSKRWTPAIVVLLGSIAFAAAHYVDQGAAGVVQALFTGTVFGTLYVVRGDIWASVAAHATFDVAAVLIIYFDLEVRLAQAIFA